MPNIHDVDFSSMPEADRLLLAHELLQSVVEKASPISQAEIEEIGRRVAEIESGAVTFEPWSKVRAELRRCLE